MPGFVASQKDYRKILYHFASRVNDHWIGYYTCDGIWDVINNQQVATFVSNKTSSNILQDTVSQLLDECLKLETMDNMSVYIVKLSIFQQIYFI
ncbi:unnamed protein product [Rotaria magnacalcarata]